MSPAPLAEADRDRLVEAPAPTHARPMKAVLTDRRFSDPGWIFERKLDGIRCIAIRDGGDARLLSRNDLPLDDRYPEIAEALAGNRCERFVLDGEVVAFDGSQTSFALLARRNPESTQPESVQSGRTIEEIAAEEDGS